MLLRTGNESTQLSLTFEPGRRVFTVSDLNAALQRVLESDFQGIWVAGEISGCRTAASGHYYFCLKDERSQLKCAFFRGTARYAKFKPQDGLAVIARGNLQVYEGRGEYQLIVEVLEPQGAGALQLAFEQLKRKLDGEGLFDQARKRALPRLPKRVGIVTSAAGAVIRDILHVLERRFPGLHTRVFPAQVQGEGSVEQVCAGLAYFSASGWADIVIVARGGGSLEDLWTFNEEEVARAIAASSVPVISAIGHETDFTICDFVADLRAPTPSAAAEMVVCTRESLLDQIAAARERALQAIRYRLLLCARDLGQKITDRVATVIHRALTRRAQQVDDLEYRLRHMQRETIEARKRRLSDLTRRVEAANLRLRFARIRHEQHLLRERMVKQMESKLWNAKRLHESLHLRLTQISPLAVLARGYAIVQNADGHALRSAEETSAGEPIRIRLHRGELEALVTGLRPGEEET
ncbi:MAG: exodeoxyribonuclease VII large subunit [Acidobacteriaceae bacterium]|nr:exodeoxyribonuclease VII large subunit [Acidobacteriaceae bacterium]